MSSLYSMTAEMMGLMERLLDSEEPEEQQATLQEMMAGLSDNIDAKVERIAFFMLELEGRAKVKKEISKKYAEAARAAENHAEKLKEYLILCMQNANLDKVKTDAITVTRYLGPPKVVISPDVDVALIPERFFREPPPPEIDKTAVKEALQEGDDIPWAWLDRSPALRVKP